MENEKNICLVHSGFLCHDNDANAYHHIGPVGPGLQPDFPDNYYLLAGSIYPNPYPLVTPYNINEINAHP